SFFGKDFFWGLQARGVQRKFISADFYLTEAFVEGGDELFTVKKQNALYLEPSLVWSVEGDYKPQASIMMVNSGFVDYKYDEFAMRPEWLVGFSLFPVQWYSQSLELALQAHFNDEQKTTSEFFTLAANYSFSALQIFGSLSENIYTSGFRVVYKQFSTGLSYWNERLDYIKDQKVYQQTVYIQLGFLL
ncbi:MAG: hypothetical protein ACOYOK_07955, partial [Pseudobdellovibrionaceae bacterium]